MRPIKNLFPSNSACIWSVLLALRLAVLPAWAEGDPAPPKPKEPDIVAVFRLAGPLAEVSSGESLPWMSARQDSLLELTARLGKAAEDPAVKAVVILPEAASLGLAQAAEILQSMARIREHGKEVFIHADSLMTAQYVLACGGSRISVTPSGQVLIPGLHGSSMHVRGLLDKLGVKPDFLTEGAYKSAAELFMREQPSAEADEMLNWLLDGCYGCLKEMIGRGRGADLAKVQGWLDSGLFTAAQAKAAGLIDAVEQKQDFEEVLRGKFGQDLVFNKRYGIESQAAADFSSPLALLKIWGELLRGPERKNAAKPAVGVVYVNGPILPGRGGRDPFGGVAAAYSDEVRDALEKAAADNSIKAVVLRVDSPGGSVTASEIILDATKRLKAKKPMVVSMGEVAGSGGYYVACAADTIFADATTMTGSIGVVAGKLATTGMWGKVGVTFKDYQRGQNAGILSSADVFSESERARMRLFMDEAYAVFKGHVTEIRGARLKKPVEELAGGRVYTGRQALELGLVDRIGTLADAVVLAAGRAGVTNYDVRAVPEPKSFIERLSEQMSGGREDSGRVGLGAGEASLLSLAAPYLQNLDPGRAASVASVLLRLEVLQKEGVAVTMPEIRPAE